MLRTLTFLFVLYVSCTVYGKDSTRTQLNDSLPKHSFKKALWLSSALPGAGQVYNHLAMPKGQRKAFWKVPLIYAGLGTAGYFFVQNQLTQKALKTEYTIRMETGISSPEWSDFDDAGVLTLYQQYLNLRDMSIIGFALVYLLQITDAAVEAHFVDFDVSDNIRASVYPSAPYFGSAGLSLRLNFNP
jgi:hypothetical protein